MDMIALIPRILSLSKEKLPRIKKKAKDKEKFQGDLIHLVETNSNITQLSKMQRQFKDNLKS